MTDDMELLKDYAAHDSEAAFAQIVSRHLNLVYSVALRHVGNPHQAEEITQAVFIILARKAGALREGTVLSAWLFHTARFTAANFLRTETRRAQREQEAFMQSQTPDNDNRESWRQIAPLLDEAIASLGEADRSAVVLRFVEGREFKDVGAALGVTEDGVRMRVNRALEKLRKFFVKRGVILSAAALAGALSANAVQAAPSALAATITAAAAIKGISASASTSTLIQGTIKLMAWTKLKSAAVISVAVLLTAGTTTLAYKHFSSPALPEPGPGAADDPRVKDIVWKAEPLVLEKEPPIVHLRPAEPLPPRPVGERTYSFEGGPTTISVAGAARTTGGAPGGRGMVIAGSGDSVDGMMSISADGSQMVAKGDKMLALSVQVVALLPFAFNFDRQDHIIVPDDLPREKFDLLVGLQQGGREELQKLLKEKFGLTARRELRQEDALMLTVKTTNAPGLKPDPDAKGVMSTSTANGKDKLAMKGTSMAGLAHIFGNLLKTRVIDQTGLDGQFDFKLVLPSHSDTTTDNIRNISNAIQDQLGLALTPATEKESVEYLIVEKVR